jgi:hypothetical protein
MRDKKWYILKRSCSIVAQPVESPALSLYSPDPAQKGITLASLRQLKLGASEARVKGALGEPSHVLTGAEIAARMRGGGALIIGDVEALYAGKEYWSFDTQAGELRMELTNGLVSSFDNLEPILKKMEEIATDPAGSVSQTITR